VLCWAMLCMLRQSCTDGGPAACGTRPVAGLRPALRRALGCTLTSTPSSSSPSHIPGLNNEGQLGLGPDNPAAATAGVTPAPVDTDLRFQAIAAGGDFTCAVLA